MNKDRPKTSQNIIVINRFSLYGGIGGVVRIVLTGLQAVGDLSVGCPVGGRLEIDPGSAGVVGLEVRIHGAGGNDRRVRIGGQRKCCAEHEHIAEQHSNASAPFGFENWQSPPM